VSTPAAPPVKPSSRRSRWARRIIWALVSVLVLFFALLFGTSFWFRSVGGARLREALADVERRDPAWRWEALINQRRAVSPEHNSATLVETTAALLPQRWPPQMRAPGPDTPFGAGPPEVAFTQYLHVMQPQNLRLDPAVATALKNALELVPDAVAGGRRLNALSTGRFKIARTPGEYMQLCDSPRPVRRVVEFLDLDAARRADAGDIKGALSSAHAALNAARSIGEEPSMMAQLGRMGAVSAALRTLERVLAQGETSETTLAALQSVLADEAGQPLMVHALRGERAISFDMMESLKAGDLRGFLASDSSNLNLAAAESQLGRFEIWLKRGWFEENQARILEELTRLIELQDLPPAERHAGLQQIDRRLKDEMSSDSFFGQRYRGNFLYLYMPAAIKVSEGHLRSQAELGCMSALLAAERYRLKHGRWPESLAALVPEFLAEVPVDPFAAGPIQLRRLPDGLVIYSVGRDGKDNNGAFNRERATTIDTDLGFRLWDPAERRKPVKRSSVSP